MQTPPVLFIILDGVRKDRLSLYGHKRETSPHLDSLADDSVVFENAYTSGPWSLPAHTSMLTGQYPSEHGLTNVFSNELPLITDELNTIADVLSDRGYRTGGFSNNPWLGQTSGLDKRFDLFLEWDLQFSTLPRGWELTKWERRHSRLHKLIGKLSGQPLSLLKDGFFVSHAFSSAERWLQQGSKPPYTFINVMGAHTPYYPSKSAFEKIGVNRPSLLELRLMDVRIMKDAVQNNGLASTHTERIREIYDASIRAQDEQLGGLLKSLKKDDLYDETMIIIAADHGKTLGEFDRNAIPTHYIRDVNVNVPLVIKPPHHTEKNTVSEPFEIIRLFDFLDQNKYSSEWLLENTSKYALIEDFTPHTASTKQEVTQWRAITNGEIKYIVDGTGNEYIMNGTGPTESLCEKSNQIDQMRDALDQKLSQLDESSDGTAANSSQLDKDVESKLKDLGYLG
jgi:choline-sulfatase